MTTRMVTTVFNVNDFDDDDDGRFDVKDDDNDWF